MTTHSVKTLHINGREYEAKGSMLFTKKAAKVYKATKDEEGKMTGYQGIYLGLINEDPEALSAFFQSAIVTGFSEETVDNAIQAEIEKLDGDWAPLFKGALEVMEYDLMLKGLVKKFWDKMEVGLNKEKDQEARAELQEQINTMKAFRDQVLGVTQETH